MNPIEVRHKYKELQVQRSKIERRIKELQMIESVYDCSGISFKVLQSSVAWSSDLEIRDRSKVKKLKATILEILGEANEST